MNVPKPEEYAEFYYGYVKLAENLVEASTGDIVKALQKQSEDFSMLLKSLPQEHGGYAYAQG